MKPKPVTHCSPYLIQAQTRRLVALLELHPRKEDARSWRNCGGRSFGPRRATGSTPIGTRGTALHDRPTLTP